jgi:hypothetical protein
MLSGMLVQRVSNPSYSGYAIPVLHKRGWLNCWECLHIADAPSRCSSIRWYSRRIADAPSRYVTKGAAETDLKRKNETRRERGTREIAREREREREGERERGRERKERARKRKEERNSATVVGAVVLQAVDRVVLLSLMLLSTLFFLDVAMVIIDVAA